VNLKKTNNDRKIDFTATLIFYLKINI